MIVQRGIWFDGEVAIGRAVTIEPNAPNLIIHVEHGGSQAIDSSELVKVDSGLGKMKFGHRRVEGWRLVLVEPYAPAVMGLLPAKRGTVGHVVGRKKLGVLAALSLSITLIVGMVVFTPQLLAEHMPLSWERRIGSAFNLPLNSMRCTDRGAQAALEHIIDRIDPSARRDGFTIEIVDLDEANAAALPGGRMIVLNGLFDDIDNPNAIAGIVAHEIAHVRRRHVAAGMIRELGLGTIITLAGGGAVANNAGGLLSMSFTREAEAEADGDAIAMLRNAGIDPRPTAAAFEKFRRQEGDWPEWMGDHPSSGRRAKLFAASYRPSAAYRPVLDAAQAKAMLSACRG